MTKQKSTLTDKGDKEAEVYFQTTKGVFHPSEIKVSKLDKAETKQLKEAEEQFLNEKGLIEPPYDVGGLLWLKDNSEYFDACAHQIATDVAGMGYELRLKEGKPEKKEERKRIEEYLREPNNIPGESFEKLVKKAIIDWAVIGWFGIELSRESDGEPTGLWNIPAHTIRIHKDKNKFCQVRGQRKVWFKKFGYEDLIDSETGEEKKKPNTAANELIYYKEYNQQSDYYGRPYIIPAIGAVRGLIGIRDYNLAFFENYGVPLGWIVLEGNWKKGSEKKITDFWNTNIKGTENAHKVMVVKVPTGKKIIWVPLEEKEVKEGSFQKLEVILRDKILVPYRMPPYRLGIAEEGSLGGSTARESSRIYADSVINPLKKEMSALFTRAIIRECFKSENYDLVFKIMDVRDVTKEIERVQMKFEMGTLTPLQIMETLGIKITDEEKDNELLSQYYISTKYRSIDQALEKGAGIAREIEDMKCKVDEAIKKAKEE